jgi:hypothetical protein
VNRKVSKHLAVTVERTREFVNEGSHKSPGSRFNQHLGIGVDHLTVLVLVSRRDEYGDALLKILLRYASERVALRVEVPIRAIIPTALPCW